MKTFKNVDYHIIKMYETSMKNNKYAIDLSEKGSIIRFDKTKPSEQAP